MISRAFHQDGREYTDGELERANRLLALSSAALGLLSEIYDHLVLNEKNNEILLRRIASILIMAKGQV